MNLNGVLEDIQILIFFASLFVFLWNENKMNTLLSGAGGLMGALKVS
jgi:hypothetical protein